MKNKVVKCLSIMLSLCMLGSSAAEAAEFSSGVENVAEVPETTEVPENVQAGGTSGISVGESELSEEGEVFSEQKEEEPFSDSDQVAEFSADEETDEIPM